MLAALLGCAAPFRAEPEDLYGFWCFDQGEHWQAALQFAEALDEPAEIKGASDVYVMWFSILGGDGMGDPHQAGTFTLDDENLPGERISFAALMMADPSSVTSSHILYDVTPDQIVTDSSAEPSDTYEQADDCNDVVPLK